MSWHLACAENIGILGTGKLGSNRKDMRNVGNSEIGIRNACVLQSFRERLDHLLLFPPCTVSLADTSGNPSCLILVI